MIITPRSVTVADLALAPSPPRSEGVHVSTIIRALCKAAEPERFSDEGDPTTRFEIGYTVERAVERAWAERHITVLRPGEFTLDGITGSRREFRERRHGEGDQMYVDVLARVS
jgi:hypothetical protein